MVDKKKLTAWGDLWDVFFSYKQLPDSVKEAKKTDWRLAAMVTVRETILDYFSPLFTVTSRNAKRWQVEEWKKRGDL